MTLTKQQKKSLDKIREADFKIAVKERAQGLCENCLSQGEHVTGIDPHHIWPKSTARRPNKWDSEQLLSGLEAWPHVEINGVYLCTACHVAAHGERRPRKGGGPGIRISRPYFYRLLRNMYGDRIWQGKTYREWLKEEPFKRWL